MIICHLFILLIIVNSIITVDSTCNITKYQEWKNIKYTGSLATDSTFWRYQTQSFYVLRNDLAIQLAVQACRNRFDLLYYYKSGQMGPISEHAIWKQMCHEYCLESDVMHEEVISYTGCSCLELSTKPEEGSYNMEGDFCRESSARILCDKMELCGIWDCRIDDFTCPRYEYNKKKISFKGFGSCVKSSASKIHSNAIVWTFLLSLSAILYLLTF